MKTANVVLIGILAGVLLLAIVFGSMWAGAYNGAVEKQNDVQQKQTQIYSAYANRYDKVAAYIDAIQSADATILNQLTAITDARTAFADAIAAGQLDVADGASSTIESTFINLVSYMEENPSNWTTVGLTAAFMSEFSASTNAVTYAINTYNQAITNYNTHIQLFPNNLFTSGFNVNNNFYTAPNYANQLPGFEE